MSLLSETPRQRIYRFNRQVKILKEIDYNTNFCEQPICTFCEYFSVWEDDADCRVAASAWVNGDQDEILHCRKFRAIKNWQVKLLTILEDNTFKTLKVLQRKLEAQHAKDQKPETTARQDMAHFQATQYQPDDDLLLSDDKAVDLWEQFDPEKPIPLADMLRVITSKQLNHCTPLIEARERERIYKVLTGKCKLHYPTDRNRSDYMKPQIVIDEKDYLEALKPEFKKGAEK